MIPIANQSEPATGVDLSPLVTAAAGLRWEDIPEPVRDHARRVVADTIGVSLGGGQRPEVQAFVRGDDALFPPPKGGTSHMLVPGLPRSDAVSAAYVNALAGTFLELDEGYRPTGHPAMHVVPAALAAAEALHSPGTEFLAAVLAGYEVTARLFELYTFTYPLHPHGHVGAVGAAVAVAALRRVDPVEPAYIAATLPLLSVWQSCFEGATARNAYMAHGAAVGVLANRMALAGFRGARGAQEAAFGGLTGELAHPEVLTEPVVPATLRITRNYLKLHSACALCHSALDAVMALGPIDPGEVERIEVETIANHMKVAGQARSNNLSTRFSLPYSVAAAIVHGRTSPDAFEPDPRVAALAERVEVRVAQDLERLWPSAGPARVTVHLADGARCERVDNPRGHHANPASPADLRAKFLAITGLPDAERVYERLLGLDEVPDVATLFEVDR
jgi:2-methylcitrate dehydratase PrpD